MTRRSEKELVKRCRRGDDQAYAQLVECYKDMVFTLIDRMIFDKSILEDLAQEVFIRVFKGLPHFRGRSKLSTWIYRITYNVCLAEIGAAGDRPEHLATENRTWQEIGWDSPQAQEDAVYWVERLELRETIGRLVDRLPPHYRMAVALYYLEDASYKEIAEIMKLPIGTVKTYLHRAKKRLREMILREGPEEWTAGTA